MPRARINVTNHQNWGRLVKTWATGRNYVDHQPSENTPNPSLVEGPPKYPKPTSFEDFVGQCKKAQVGLFFQDDVDNPAVQGNEGMGFVVLQVTSETAVLRLPAKEKIEESEKWLIDGGTYKLPDFYTRVFGKYPDPQDTKVKKMTLHAERVGEYTINTCA